MLNTYMYIVLTGYNHPQVLLLEPDLRACTYMYMYLNINKDGMDIGGVKYKV